MPNSDQAWEKPSIYSVLIIAVVFALIGWALYVDKLTFTESLLAAVLGVVTWVTRGARPAVVNRIGSNRPPPPPPGTPLPPPIPPPPAPPPPAPRALFVLLMMVVACGAGNKVCAVIDVAHQSCIVLRYLESDGTEREVRLSPDEAKEFAKSAAAKQRLTAGDGGAQ